MTLDDILNSDLGEFRQSFVNRKTREELEVTYELLISYGLSDEKIASHATLLGFDPETVERNYNNLHEMGLSDEKIDTYANLLGFNPETFERNYARLQEKW